MMYQHWLSIRRSQRINDPRRRRKGERGAALVEFTIVSMLLATMAIGTYEIGLAWNDAQLVTQAARSGARTAAQLGDDANADVRTIEAVEAGLGNLGDLVTKIVIYQADNADGSMSAACETASPPGNGQCSVYDKNHFASFSQGSWYPSVRDDTLNNADYIGVYIELERPLITDFFGPLPLTVTDYTVMRIEPDPNG